MEETQSRTYAGSSSAGSALLDALAGTGFTVCTFGPSDGDECECCHQGSVQLYYRRTSHECEEGEYICGDCVVMEHEQNQIDLKEVQRKETEGHATHCACRLVWGDGECECGI